MTNSFENIKQKKEIQLNKLLEKKSNWHINNMSIDQMTKLHSEIIRVEEELKMLESYKSIKRKFRIK